MSYCLTTMMKKTVVMMGKPVVVLGSRKRPLKFNLNDGEEEEEHEKSQRKVDSDVDLNSEEEEPEWGDESDRNISDDDIVKRYKCRQKVESDDGDDGDDDSEI